MTWLYLLGVCGGVVVLVMSRIAKPIRHALPPPIGFRGIESLDPMEVEEQQANGKVAAFVSDNRPRAVMLGCTLCTGVWIGLIVGLYSFFYEFLPRILTRVADAILFSFAAAFLSYVGGTWLREHDKIAGHKPPPRPADNGGRTGGG